MSTLFRYQALKREIAELKQQVVLQSMSALLLGVSKTQPVEAIEELIKAGLQAFGENRVQEAEAKWPDLKKRYPNVELHLIGPLQTNKVKAALALFDVIETVDRPKLVEEIAKVLGCWSNGVMENKNTPPLHHSTTPSPRFYIQINTGDEPQKAGVSPKDVDDLLYLCRELQLPVTGLMCIPPSDQPPAPHFALLYEIAKRHNLKELSMGMSADYPTAIRMGSTCVRLGTALFGERVS